MSYCRFSSDGFRSDVYVYLGVGGYHILVAQFHCTNDFVYPELLPAPSGKRALERHCKAVSDKQKHWIATMTRTKLELEHAGDEFVLRTAREAVDRLKYLSALGFHVPESCFQALQSEVEDERTSEVELK